MRTDRSAYRWLPCAIHPGTSAPGADAFSKRMLIARILRRPGIRPHHPIGLGDGPVEIEELKRAGALAVGLATGAPDYIIPNYLCRPVLLPVLFFNHEPI
jgi:hypothetical protein